MGRIASHLVGMGAYGLDLGTFSPFLYAFREREKILDLFEEACGARLTYSYLTPAARRPICRRGWLQKCEAFLDQFDAAHPRVSHAADDQRDLRQADGRHRRHVARDGDRLRHAAARCCAAAASITTCAATAKSIYTAMYDGYAFEVIVRAERPLSEGPRLSGRAARGGARRLLAPVLRADAGSRAVDRPRAGRRSTATARRPAATASRSSSPQKLPKGEAYLETEAPRGQMGFYIVSDGELDSLARPGPQQLASATCRSRTSCAAAA